MSSLKDILNIMKDNVTHYGYPASLINIDELNDIEVPELIRDEIPTLNKFGYMKIDVDEYTEDFIKLIEQTEGICLDLGTAYGFVAKKILEKGGQIIANDISYEHLSYLLKTTTKEDLKNLYLYPGRFPDEITLPANSIKAVYTARMLHFLDEREIDLGLKKIHDWLQDDGKLYFISVTPYHANIRDKFQNVYEDRLQGGEKWPGRIESQWEINPAQKDFVPEFLHVFEPKALEKILPEYGFEIEKIGLFDYINDVNSDGKGHVGVIARKRLKGNSK
jgi:SAM-dependent methyltransferase